MVKDLAVRNYFETHGSFTNIRNDMKGRVADMTEEDMYAAIGFEPYGNFSGKEVFMIRKLYLQGNLDQAMKRGQFKTEEELADFLISSYNIYMPTASVEINNYIELISTYIKENILYHLKQDVANSAYVEGLQATFENELSRKLRQVEKTRESDRFVSGVSFNKKETEFFDNFWDAWAPEIVVVKNSEPKIVNTVMTVPNPVSKEDLEYIKNAVNLALVLDVTTFPPELAWDYINYCSVYNFTELLNNSDRQIQTIYTAFLDVAITRDVTIKDLLGSIGFNLIEYWRQYRDTKCIFMLQSEDKIKYCNGDKWKLMNLGEFYNEYGRNNLMSI